MPKPLRILIGCDTFGPNVNGAAKFAERLAAGLVQRGHTVAVMAPAASRKHGVWEEVHEGQPMRMYRIYSWRWYPHDWLRFMLPWRVRHNSRIVLDDFQPDVVHFQSHLVVGVGLSKEAHARGIRLIGTNHLMPENMMEFTLLPKAIHHKSITMMWKTAARIFARAEAVTTPTRNAADFLEKYTHLTDVHAISCGINASDYTPNLSTDTPNHIVFVGRITGEKKLDVLLKAFTQLPPELNATMEFVGGGDLLQSMKNQVKALGLSDKISFPGYVSDEELRNSLRRAKVFAMPSIAELQSIATMEAMATALPIVGANAMALPHLIHDGENGYLFNPNDADDLARKLTTVLTADAKELLRLKKNSLKFIKGHDINRTIDTFEALYRGEDVVDPDPELTGD